MRSVRQSRLSAHRTHGRRARPIRRLSDGRSRGEKTPNEERRGSPDGKMTRSSEFRTLNPGAPPRAARSKFPQFCRLPNPRRGPARSDDGVVPPRGVREYLGKIEGTAMTHAACRDNRARRLSSKCRRGQDLRPSRATARGPRSGRGASAVGASPRTADYIDRRKPRSGDVSEWRPRRRRCAARRRDRMTDSVGLRPRLRDCTPPG